MDSIAALFPVFSDPFPQTLQRFLSFKPVLTLVNDLCRHCRHDIYYYYRTMHKHHQESNPSDFSTVCLANFLNCSLSILHIFAASTEAGESTFGSKKGDMGI